LRPSSSTAASPVHAPVVESIPATRPSTIRTTPTLTCVHHYHDPVPSLHALDTFSPNDAMVHHISRIKQNTHINAFMHANLHTYTHTYIHSYIHTYIHTYLCTEQDSPVCNGRPSACRPLKITTSTHRLAIWPSMWHANRVNSCEKKK
jgi:hypothetical protein